VRRSIDRSIERARESLSIARANASAREGTTGEGRRHVVGVDVAY
jgi:hypothetical protein